MSCISCGTAIPSDSNICPYCGYIYRVDTGPLKRVRRTERSMSVIIVAIVIAIILSQLLIYAIFYFQIANIGNGNPPEPAVSFYLENAKNDVKCTFTFVKGDMGWSDITIKLDDRTNRTFWLPSSHDFVGAPYAKAAYPPQTMGELTLWLNITDLEGNGKVNSGDYFVISTASSPTFSPHMFYDLELSDRGNQWSVGTGFSGNSTSSIP